MLIEATRRSVYRGRPPAAPSDFSTAVGRSRAADAGLAANASGELLIGQLLCSRLCHDLIGPTLAINAGEELIRDGDGDGDTEGEARDLIADSARQLTGRLSFFRAVFTSSGGAAAAPGMTDARALAEGFLLGGRVRLAWPAAAGNAPGLGHEAIRLLLSMVMLAADALPRGGTLHVGVRRCRGRVHLSVRAIGPGVRLAPELLETARGDNAAGPSARTVHAFYLAHLARRSGAQLRIHAPDGQPLRLSAGIAAAADGNIDAVGSDAAEA